jgi:hypothetical protein
MRVFLDANVLFSASNSGSNIARLVEWVVAEATAVTSDVACAEARRNLALKRPDWLPAFDQLVLRIEQVPSALFELPVTLDDKDRPLLCAAIRGGCTHFATGDRRDFGHLFDKTVEQVQVVHLLRLAERLGER